MRNHKPAIDRVVCEVRDNGAADGDMREEQARELVGQRQREDRNALLGAEIRHLRERRVPKAEPLALLPRDHLARPDRVGQRPRCRQRVGRRSGPRRALQQPFQLRRGHQRAQHIVNPRRHVELFRERRSEIQRGGRNGIVSVDARSREVDRGRARQIRECREFVGVTRCGVLISCHFGTSGT